MFKDYAKRLAVCLSGLLICGLGLAFGAQSGSAGTGSWNSLALGLSDITGLSFGTMTILVGVAIIFIDLIGKGKLGLGTLLNTLLIGSFSDVFILLLPMAENPVLGTFFTLLGQTLMSFGTVVYMAAALGCGPRDTLMVIIGNKLPKMPIGMVRFILESCALAVGLLLGAPFGFGTVAVTVLQAAIFQFACTITHYEPREIQHEDILDTCRKIFKKQSA